MNDNADDQIVKLLHHGLLVHCFSFAPWCPACRSLQPVWEDFASWSRDLGIQVGQVDITSSPGLSGRFMITGTYLKGSILICSFCPLNLIIMNII